MSDRLSRPPGTSPNQPAPGTVPQAIPPHVAAAAPRPRDIAGTVARALGNLVAAGVLVYLTYFFTTFFAYRAQPPAPLSEDVRVAAKKIEELRAEDRKLLSTYGEVDPATRTLRIPVARAMELVAAESTKPAPSPSFSVAPAPTTVAVSPTAAAPKPVETVTAPARTRPDQIPAHPDPVSPAPRPEPGPETIARKPVTPAPETVAAKAAAPAPAVPAALSPAPATVAVVALPPPGAARGGFTQSQLFGFVCKSCHDADGKGGVGRKSPEPGMALIPDFTDPKWQLSRTNADLTHSMLEGKGQGMKPVKDKLELAKLQPEEMAAFIRSFSPSTMAATLGVPSPAPETKPAASAVESASTPKPAAPTPSAAVSTRPAEPKRTAPVVASASTTKPSTPEAVKPAATASTGPAERKPAAPAVATSSSPKPASPEPVKPATAATPEPEALTPEQMKLLAALASSPGATASTGSTVARPNEPTVPPETISFFMLNCLACHGPDGRGMSTARAAMPPLPDFTVKQWQLDRTNPQLKVSILDGKGTYMPTWRGKVSPELAQSLVTYIRGFGPPGLFASQAAPASEFAKSFDALQKEWDALESQMKSMSRR